MRSDFRKDKHLIEIFTVLGEVYVRGKKLEELHKGLLENQVSWIQKFYQEMQPEEELEEGKAWIEEIEFEEVKES